MLGRVEGTRQAKNKIAERIERINWDVLASS